MGVFLHFSAKVRDADPGGLPISDPDGLLRWLAHPRASIVFRGLKDFRGKRGRS